MRSPTSTMRSATGSLSMQGPLGGSLSSTLSPKGEGWAGNISPKTDAVTFSDNKIESIRLTRSKSKSNADANPASPSGGISGSGTLSKEAAAAIEAIQEVKDFEAQSAALLQEKKRSLQELRKKVDEETLKLGRTKSQSKGGSDSREKLNPFGER